MNTGAKVIEALAPYGVKDEGSGKYRANSPLRPGANSHSFTLTIASDGEHGAWHDKVTDESGSLYQLAEKLGIEPPRGKDVASTKRIYTGIADYAAAHGITPDVLAAAGWMETVQDGRKALAFKTATGVRYRFLDGEKPPYKSPPGYKSCFYGLKKALEMAKGAPLVLCNGEVSTVTAQHYGIPAFCVTGGEKKMPPALVEELKAAHKGALLIAFDCDETGRRAARDVQAQLAGGAPVQIVDLGLGDAGDLADFCMLHGHDAAIEILTTPVVTAAQISVGLDIGALSAAAKELAAAMRQDAKARQQHDVETLMATLQAELDRARMHTTSPLIRGFDELADEGLQLLEIALTNPDPVRGLRSRIKSLDEAIGGFTPEVYCIYGAPSMGKSTLAVSLAREFVTQGAGLIASTESPPVRWMTKLVGALTRIPSDSIETGRLTAPQVEQVRATYTKLKSMSCHFLQAGSPTPAQLRAAVLKGVQEYGYKWVIVDSASKMSAPGSDSIYDITRSVSNGLQDLYQEVGLPIIITSQVGRDVASRGKGQKLPLLEDGYGGGTIEQNAGVVMALYNHQYYVDFGTEDPNDRYPAGTALVRILKNRWNPGARRNAVMLTFVGGAGFYETELRKREAV